MNRSPKIGDNVAVDGDSTGDLLGKIVRVESKNDDSILVVVAYDDGDADEEDENFYLESSVEDSDLRWNELTDRWEE